MTQASPSASRERQSGRSGHSGPSGGSGRRTAWLLLALALITGALLIHTRYLADPFSHTWLSRRYHGPRHIHYAYQSFLILGPPGAFRLVDMHQAGEAQTLQSLMASPDYFGDVHPGSRGYLFGIWAPTRIEQSFRLDVYAQPSYSLVKDLSILSEIRSLLLASIERDPSSVLGSHDPEFISFLQGGPASHATALPMGYAHNTFAGLLAMAAMGLAFAATRSGVMFIRALRLPKPGHCLCCGYDLTGLVAPAGQDDSAQRHDAATRTTNTTANETTQATATRAVKATAIQHAGVVLHGDCGARKGVGGSGSGDGRDGGSGGVVVCPECGMAMAPVCSP